MGPKCPIIDDDYQIPQGYQRQQHFQQHVATHVPQIWLNQQDKKKQPKQQEREQFMRKYQPGPSRPNETPNILVSNCFDNDSMEEQKGQKHPTIKNETPNVHPNIDAITSVAQPNNEPGKGAMLVADYLSKLRNRPQHNNDVFGKTFVVKFFPRGAICRQCISRISVGRSIDECRCDLCNHDLTDGSLFLRTNSRSDSMERGKKCPMMENETSAFHPTIDASYSLAQPKNEPGKGAFFVADYLSKLQNRPHDNDDIFWKTFVVKFFAYGAIYRQCISNISVGPPKDKFHCDLCNYDQPVGLEGSILSALFWIKYQSGVLGELWSTDLPSEYQNITGQIILDYDNATHETLYESIRVVQAGKLRVVLTPDFKIYSWNFCVRQSEEHVPRSFLNTKLVQLEEAAQSSRLDLHTVFPHTPAQVLVDNFKRIVTPVLDIAKTFESPIDKKLGLPVKFVKYLQLVRGNVDKIKNYIKQNGASHVENLEHFLAMSNSAASYHEGSNPAVTEPHYYGSQETLLKESQDGIATRNCHEESLNQIWNVGNSQSIPALRGKQNNGDHNLVQSRWCGSGFVPANSSNLAHVNQRDWGSSSSSSYGADFGSKEPFLDTSSQTRRGYEARYPEGLNLVQTRWTNPNPVSGFTSSSSNYSLGNQHQALGSRSLLTSCGTAACGGSHIQFQQPSAGKTVCMWEPQNQSFSNMASEGGTSGVVSNVVVAATSTPADQVLETIPFLAGRQGHSTRADQVFETIPILAGREDHRTRTDQVLETIPFLAGREDHRTRVDQVLESIPILVGREDHHRTRADQVFETIPDLAGREEAQNNQSSQLADGNNTDDVELNNILLEWESIV